MMTPRFLAPHVLRYLASAQRRGRPVTLDDVVAKLQVRRPEVRAAITAMHAQGLLDATTMRLSLEGFAIGAALGARKLPAIARSAPAAETRVEGSGEHTLEVEPPSIRPRPIKRIAAA